MKNYIVNLIVVILVFVACLYGIEYILSANYIIPNKTSRIPSTGSRVLGGGIDVKQYEFSTNIKYNSNGFREVEFDSINLSKNKYRLVFLGDSFSEGWGVDVNERLSELVVNKLKHNKYISINLSQLATQPVSYYLNLLDFGVAMKPDIVIMTFFSGNDFMHGDSTKLDTQDVNYDVSSTKYSIIGHNSLWSKMSVSYIGALIYQIQSGKEILVKRVSYDNYWNAYYRENNWKTFIQKKLDIESDKLEKMLLKLDPEFVAQGLNGYINPGHLLEAINNLTEIDNEKNQAMYYTERDYLNVLEYIKATQYISNTVDAEFIAVIIPSIYDINHSEYVDFLKDTLKFREIPKRFEEAKSLKNRLVNDLKKSNVNVIDMTKTYMAEDRQVYYLIDGHLNKLGHELIAKKLIEFLRENYIVDDGRINN